MPAVPPVSTTLRVIMKWTVGVDANCITRLYFIYSGSAPTVAQCNDVASAVSTSFAANLRSLLNASWSYTGCEVQDLSSSIGAQGSDSSVYAGSRSGGSNAADLCVLVNYGIARRYRGGKPRSYWPFGSVSDILTSRTWTTTLVGQVNTGVAAFVGGVISDSASAITITAQANVSLYSGVNPPITLPSGRVKQSNKLKTTTVTPDAISSWSASQIIGNQRRRLQRTS